MQIEAAVAEAIFARERRVGTTTELRVRVRSGGGGGGDVCR